MIRVVCPFTAIKPGVAEALDATGIAWEAIDVSGSDSDYWALLDSLWTEGKTFIIVEHDVIVRPDTLDLLRYCTQSDVCAYPISYFWSRQAVGMACNKFGSTFIARHLDLMQQTAEMSDANILQNTGAVRICGCKRLSDPRSITSTYLRWHTIANPANH